MYYQNVLVSYSIHGIKVAVQINVILLNFEVFYEYVNTLKSIAQYASHIYNLQPTKLSYTTLYNLVHLNVCYGTNHCHMHMIYIDTIFPVYNWIIEKQMSDYTRLQAIIQIMHIKLNTWIVNCTLPGLEYSEESLSLKDLL